jgi:hypothetical protein
VRITFSPERFGNSIQDIAVSQGVLNLVGASVNFLENERKPMSTGTIDNPPKLRNGDLSARFLRHGFVGFRAGFPLL